MSLIIKAPAANGSVRPFLAPARVQPGPGDIDAVSAPIAGEAPGSGHDEEKEALRLEVEALKLALKAADKAKSDAERSARQEEQLAARRAREAEEQAGAEQLTMLAESLDRMTLAWEKSLADLDGLAALVARCAISKLFDSWDEASEFVIRTTSRQVRLIRREAIAAIQVSGEDFPDQRALDELAQRAATGSIRILVDPDLAAGECRVDLQLGHIDLGARTQQAELITLLEALAETDGVAR